MAKPDWGELQQRFLSDHADTSRNPLRKLRKNLRRRNCALRKRKSAQKSWWWMMASPINNVYLSRNT